MRGRLGRRLLWTLTTIALMSMVAFLLVAIAPGDPVVAELRFMGVPATPNTVEALRREFDLDAPLPVRYARWIVRLSRLDLGESIASGRPVAAELARALPWTLQLAFVSLVMIVALSLSTGLAAALHPYGRLTTFLRGLTIMAISIPVYWLALAAVGLGAVVLGWSTVVSDASLGGLLLPAFILSLAPGLAIGRVVRQRVIDERLEDHVHLAVALGRSPAQILIQDVGVVIGPSLVTMWATTFGYLLGGAVVVERIFDRPGLGNLALHAIAARDYPVLQAYLLCAGVAFVLVNAAADLLSAWLDPRLRRSRVDD